MSIKEYLNSCSEDFKTAIKLDIPYMSLEVKKGIRKYLRTKQALYTQDFDDIRALTQVITLIVNKEGLL